MLVLTRRMGEGIMLGDDIFITLLRITGKQVSIGINAPSSLSILRDELYQKKYFITPEKNNDTIQGNI